MDLLCKTSDAARAGLQVGGQAQARPDETRRHGGTATNGTRELPYSPVQYGLQSSPVLATPGSCRGEGSEMKRPGVMDERTAVEDAGSMDAG